jgi:hypothetical protein
MAGNSSWQMWLYAANADTSSTAYDTVAASSLAALSGYVNITTGFPGGSCPILAPAEDAEFETSTLVDIGGGTIGTANRRTIWTVECWPFLFDASTTETDLDDYFALSDGINGKKYLWVRFTAGSRISPTTSGHVYPVVLESWQGSLNKEFGNRNLTLVLKHRFRQASSLI